jgi:hypothetical protein
LPSTTISLLEMMMVSVLSAAMVEVEVGICSSALCTISAELVENCMTM